MSARESPSTFTRVSKQMAGILRPIDLLHAQLISMKVVMSRVRGFLDEAWSPVAPIVDVIEF
jgi:hypothetical protein